ncbi:MULTISPECIES: RluA family pseudouridine synthase [Clostridium]|uniref:Pseudouridine synthase n=1 Tax=Clostridium faecium TaxID=2762223 RepID=A0ABR8YS28_9CLOT|nr:MULTISPECIES: RluA family pseudouridine synthase [Clostridium]MBD8047050.1 RluA family pseudouridine synthase [Clostridium faecium]MDU1348214.1 RluA family pseudouridine synthase [Clostridium argentinense]
MSNNLIYEVLDCGDGMKVREYMTEVLELSRRFTKNAGLNKRIYVNKNIVKLNHRLNKGDIIEVQITKNESQNIIPEDIDIDVIYEDSELLVVNKKPNMVVHPTKSYPTGTLSNGILYYFKEKGENCIVRLVSRLDMDTSGLIMVAKNQFAHMNLAKSMENNLITKSYLAIVHGVIKEEYGTIDAPIGRPTEDSIKREVMEHGQNSITHFKVVERYKNATLVELTLETGRTHQIRVHLSYINHPIYGDSLYGIEEKEYIKRQALHAYKLVIPHPRTGEILKLESKLPEDMEKLLNKLGEKN